NIQAFVDATEEAKAIYEKPTVIIAHTIPGKGIKEIEFDYRWHGIPPGHGPTDKVAADKQAEVFLKELRTLKGKIQSEHE
ncbi:MAG TPA: transketolase, partial [Candidatus Paceibacterota bacterium]